MFRSSTLLFIFFIAVGVKAEYGDILSEARFQDVTGAEVQSETETGPSDVVSVSKFIQEFHRKFEENSYVVHEEPKSSSLQPVSPEPAIYVPANVIVPETQNVDNQTESNATSTLVNCNTERQAGALSVELVNSTRLLNLLTSDANVTSRIIKADCIMLLFYAHTCPFSCMAAPHFNALPRAFPSIKVAAVNAFMFPSFNTQFGIVGVPTVVLYHNGRPAAKFNDSEYTLEMFARFITRYTGIPPEEKMFVTSADFGGPVPSVVAKENDYWLGLSWAVIATVGGIGIARSRAWRAIVEAVQNTWREAEAQHFHAD